MSRNDDITKSQGWYAVNLPGSVMVQILWLIPLSISKELSQILTEEI
jgi:hypothetical protein